MEPFQMQNLVMGDCNRKLCEPDKMIVMVIVTGCNTNYLKSKSAGDTKM